MSPLTTILLVAVGIGAFAALLRRMSGSGPVDRERLSGAAPTPPPHPEEEPAAEPEDEDGSAPDEIAALSSEGLLFVPFENGVELLVAGSRDEMERQLAYTKLAGMLSRGDLIAARVVRGAPAVDPWRLEALGRDRDYMSWSFETEEAARLALNLLERSVVKAPLDAEGEPAPPGPADFEAARHEKETTLQELATMPETEEPG